MRPARSRLWLIALTLCLCSATATAQENPIAYTLHTYVLTPDGPIPADTARPGQVVRYELQISHEGLTTLPPGTVVVTGPIPDGTRYVTGSAKRQSNVITEFSTDGESWSETEASGIVALRWTLLDAVQPQSEFTFRYEVYVQNDHATDPLKAQDTHRPPSLGNLHAELAQPCWEVPDIPSLLFAVHEVLIGELESDIYGCFLTEPLTLLVSTAHYDLEEAQNLTERVLEAFPLPHNATLLVEIRPSTEDPTAQRLVYEIRDEAFALQEVAGAPDQTSITEAVTREAAVPLAGAVQRFATAMYGHLGIVQFDCPTNVKAAFGAGIVCGYYDRPFGTFRQRWDLYADWTERVPIVPQPLTAWVMEGDTTYFPRLSAWR